MATDHAHHAVYDELHLRPCKHQVSVCLYGSALKIIPAPRAVSAEQLAVCRRSQATCLKVRSRAACTRRNRPSVNLTQVLTSGVGCRRQSRIARRRPWALLQTLAGTALLTAGWVSWYEDTNRQPSGTSDCSAGYTRRSLSPAPAFACQPRSQDLDMIMPYAALPRSGPEASGNVPSMRQLLKSSELSRSSSGPAPCSRVCLSLVRPCSAPPIHQHPTQASCTPPSPHSVHYGCSCPVHVCKAARGALATKWFEVFDFLAGGFPHAIARSRVLTSTQALARPLPVLPCSGPQASPGLARRACGGRSPLSACPRAKSVVRTSDTTCACQIWPKAPIGARERPSPAAEAPPQAPRTAACPSLRATPSCSKLSPNSVRTTAGAESAWGPYRAVQHCPGHSCGNC